MSYLSFQSPTHVVAKYNAGRQSVIKVRMNTQGRSIPKATSDLRRFPFCSGCILPMVIIMIHNTMSPNNNNNLMVTVMIHTLMCPKNNNNSKSILTTFMGDKHNNP